jgi:hypothetical protein
MNRKLTKEGMDEISSDLRQIEKAGTIPPSVLRNTKIRRLFRLIEMLDIPRDDELHIKERVSCLLASWGEPAALSTTQAQSKSTTQGRIIDLTGADSGHEYVTPPGTPKCRLLPSLSIGKCPFKSDLG